MEATFTDPALRPKGQSRKEGEMRLPNTTHTARPWRVHEFTKDFEVEDVWELPTPGGPDDLARLVQ